MPPRNKRLRKNSTADPSQKYNPDAEPIDRTATSDEDDFPDDDDTPEADDVTHLLAAPPTEAEPAPKPMLTTPTVDCNPTSSIAAFTSPAVTMPHCAAGPGGSAAPLSQSITTSGSVTARSAGAATTTTTGTTQTPSTSLADLRDVVVVPMCTAGDATHDGDMEWAELAIPGPHTYLVCVQLPVRASMRSTNLAVVKLPPDLRRILEDEDSESRPPGVGRQLTLQAFEPAAARLPAAFQARLGNARIVLFAPTTASTIRVGEPIFTLPTLMYPLDALARPKLRRSGNDFEPAQVARGASMAGKPATYIFYPFDAVDRYGVRKLRCVVRGEAAGVDKWIQADLVLQLAKSQRAYNDTLAQAILDAPNEDRLLAVTGKHLSPPNNRAYSPCLYADGCTITFLGLPDPVLGPLLDAARAAARALSADDGPAKRARPTTATAWPDRQEDFTQAAATAAYIAATAADPGTATSPAVADGHHAAVHVRLAGCADATVDGDRVVPIAVAFPGGSIAAAFIDDNAALQGLPSIADAGVSLADMQADGSLVLDLANVMAAPERVSVAVKRHGRLLRVTHIAPATSTAPGTAPAPTHPTLP